MDMRATNTGLWFVCINSRHYRANRISNMAVKHLGWDDCAREASETMRAPPPFTGLCTLPWNMGRVSTVIQTGQPQPILKAYAPGSGGL